MYTKKIKLNNSCSRKYAIVILLTLIMLPIIGCTDQNKAIGLTTNNLIPSQIVRLYWESSFKGEVNTVNQLITKQPGSFLNECKSKNDNKNTKVVEAKITPKLSESQADQAEPKNKKFFKNLFKSIFSRSPDGVFLEYYDKDSEFFSIYSLSHVINVNKYSTKHLFVENEFIFEDESRVNLFYNDPLLGKVFDSSIFLKKETSGWKIFLILDKSSLYLFDNENYGISKPKCVE